MKKLLLLFFIAATAAAEEIKVYEYTDYGLRNPWPSKTIEIDRQRDTVKVYKHNEYGLKDFQPSYEIKSDRPQVRDRYPRLADQLRPDSSLLPSLDLYEPQQDRW